MDTTSSVCILAEFKSNTIQHATNNIKNSYFSEYNASICLGELIRNICVNLCIDPDTVDGVTRNILVSRVIDNDTLDCEVWHDWKYDPIQNLRE
eukprot:gene15125-20359_t